MKVNDSLLPRKKEFFYTDILIGITYTLFLISIGVLVAIYFRPLYYLDITILNLEETTGLSKTVIKENYNSLIQYCSPFYKGELKFPTLVASASGLSHFAEVKTIFLNFHIIALVTSILGIVSVLLKKHYDRYGYLLISGITTLVLPIIVSMACIINFNTAFTIMHKIFFRNDDWIFDPETDPIITLLPETYFMHCAFIIIFFVILGSVITFFCYYRARNNRKTDPLMPMKKNYYY